jgi:hypothetical protein
MVQVRIRSALPRSVWVVRGKTTCMGHVSAAGRRAYEQLGIHIRQCRLVEVREALRSDSAVARKHEGADDPAQTRIRVLDGRRTGPLARFVLCCVLESRSARSQVLHWAVVFPVGQSCAVYLRIAGSASGSCSARDHKVLHVLPNGSILTASGNRGVYPFGGEAQPFLVVLQSRAWGCDGHYDDTPHIWNRWILLMGA